MWKTYRDIIRKYPRISLQEERRLIREAKRGSKAQAQELPPVTVRGREEPVAVYGIEYAPCGEIQVSEQPVEDLTTTKEE